MKSYNLYNETQIDEQPKHLDPEWHPSARINRVCISQYGKTIYDGELHLVDLTKGNFKIRKSDRVFSNVRSTLLPKPTKDSILEDPSGFPDVVSYIVPSKTNNPFYRIERRNIEKFELTRMIKERT